MSSSWHFQHGRALIHLPRRRRARCVQIRLLRRIGDRRVLLLPVRLFQRFGQHTLHVAVALEHLFQHVHVRAHVQHVVLVHGVKLLLRGLQNHVQRVDEVLARRVHLAVRHAAGFHRAVGLQEFERRGQIVAHELAHPAGFIGVIDDCLQHLAHQFIEVFQPPGHHELVNLLALGGNLAEQVQPPATTSFAR